MTEILAARLAREYDAAQLRKDLDSLKDFIPVPQASDYHKGEWRGLCLIGRNGDHMDAAAGGGIGTYKRTELLARTPYFDELIRDIPGTKRAVRLLFLPPGGYIQPHKDVGVSFESGFIRLHVPIVTDPKVEFLIGGTRCTWNPGELWYGDFSQTHSVQNKSDVLRVHLVLDILVNAELFKLFPADFAAAVSRAMPVTMEKPIVALDQARLSMLEGTIEIPRAAFPALARNGSSIIGRVFVESGELLLSLSADTSMRLRHVGDGSFSVESLPPGVELKLTTNGVVLESASLLLAGLPEKFNYEPTASGPQNKRTTRVIPLKVSQR